MATMAELAAELDRTVTNVARAVQEARSEVGLETLKGERVAVLPLDAWLQVEEALREWDKATQAFLAGSKSA